MTHDERERVEDLSKRIAVAKDPQQFEALTLEMNELVSALLPPVQPILKRRKKKI